MAGSPADAAHPLARALAHFEAGRYDEAAGLCEQVLAQGAGGIEALLLAGRIAKRMGSMAMARRMFESAVVEEPWSPACRLALGLACVEDEALEEAETHLTTVLKFAPATYEARLALGDVCVARYRLDEAGAHYAAARELRPDAIDPLIKLSNVAKLEDDTTAAFAWLDAALAVDAENPAANWNRALLLLATGKLQAGFAAYEWRWSFTDFEFRRPALPLWDGSDLAGRSILLVAEQGWGDQIQFARYTALLKRRGAGRVVLAAPAGGRVLFERLVGADLVVDGRRFPPACDCYITLLSVPHLVGTTAATIPAEVPYLAADPERQRAWDARLGAKDKPRVGIAWREPSGATGDKAYKALRFATIAGLAEVSTVRLFALPLEAMPAPHPASIVALGPARDLGDTAAAIANMDLVIAPDTMYCHLAGALGRPVWTLLAKIPDWRWQLAPDTSPWYPTMRLFRQTALGRWDDVVAHVASALTAVGAGAPLR